MSDPAKYRPKGELEEKKLSDPIAITRKRLTEDFGVKEEFLAGIDADIEQQATEAYDFAEESPAADLSSLYDFVYAT